MPEINKQSVVTMSRIAEEAGVSKMTVSLALRGIPKIAEETRDRIRAIAREMGYRPNPLVQTLMANLRSTKPSEQGSTIAWITSFDTPDGWAEHQTHKRYFEGARARAEEHGFRLEPFWARAPNLSGSRLSGILRARGINGLIVAPVPTPDIRLQIDWDKFSCATVGFSFTEQKLHRAASNLYATMSLALEEVVRRGHKRVGFAIPATIDARVDHIWLAAFLAYEHFIPRENRIPPLFGEHPIQKHLEKWVRAHRPDVIVSPLTEFSLWLPKLGFRVPEDVGVVTLDRRYRGYSTRVSGVDQNSRSIGAAAVDLVVGMIQRNETGVPEHPKMVSIDGTWAEGETLLARREETPPPAASETGAKKKRRQAPAGKSA